MNYIVSFYVGLKCPRQIHLNPQCGRSVIFSLVFRSASELELLLEYALTPFSFIKALRLKRLGVEMKNNAQNFYRLSAENFTLASDYLLLLYD